VDVVHEADDRARAARAARRTGCRLHVDDDVPPEETTPVHERREHVLGVGTAARDRGVVVLCEGLAAQQRDLVPTVVQTGEELVGHELCASRLGVHEVAPRDEEDSCRSAAHCGAGYLGGSADAGLA
jgi:hypothetical protein